MRRFVLPIAAIALTAACSSGTPTADGSAPQTPITAIHSASASAGDTPSPVKARPKPKPSASHKECPPTRDLIVWTKAPGVPDMAQELGNYNLETCEPTMQWLKHTSPTGAGYCTEAAWASDNPSYNVDAEPAKRLKKVQVAIGPAC